MSRILFVTILLFVASCVTAEETSKTITVNGTGSAPATPDRAALHMSIVARDKSLDAAQAKAASVTNKVLAITDDLDIDRSQVDTTGASVRADYQYDRNSGEQVFKGYIAERQIIVEFRDLEQLAPVIEGAVTAGVNQVSPPNLFSTKQKESYRQALENAAKDAKANAERLADSLDVDLGSAISVSTVSAGYPMPQARGAMVSAMADSGAIESYNAADQSVRANVTVVFSIED
ncbi:MAG: SIMPL domain-containing protein [Pseudomonadota bacterium]